MCLKFNFHTGDKCSYMPQHIPPNAMGEFTSMSILPNKNMSVGFFAL